MFLLLHLLLPFPLARHPWVGFDLLTDFPPFLSRLHINSPISAPDPRDGLLCLVVPPLIRSASPNSNSSWFCTKDFICRINFFHPYHMSGPSKSIKLNKGLRVRKCKNENYTAVALHMIIKCMAKILPLPTAYVNVKPEKHF